MSEISTTGYEKRIAAEFPDLSKGQVRKAAKRIAWRAANMHEFDFYAEFERFRELAENRGWGAEEIGARFGNS